MRILILLAPLALLAACGGTKAANNSAGNASAANASANTAGPAAAVAPAAAPTAAVSSDPRRAEMVAECTGDAPNNLPAGTDVAALCGCAVDRALAGSREGEAMQACASQMGVALPKS